MSAQNFEPVPCPVYPSDPYDALVLLATVARSRESAFQAKSIEIAIKALRPLVEAHIAADRHRVVGVLDAWATKPGSFRVSLTETKRGEWMCLCEHSDDSEKDIRRYGATPDAARAAAAKAIESGEVK